MTPERSPSKRWSWLWRMRELMLERLATKPKRWDGGQSAGEIAARIMGVTEGKSAAAWEYCVCYSRNVFSIVYRGSLLIHPPTYRQSNQFVLRFNQLPTLFLHFVRFGE